LCVVLLLNAWFFPWISVLIVTAALILAGTTFLMAKKGAAEARKRLSPIREDMKWLKRN
jgi:CHASE2 domain-containing sensor protein